MIDKRAVISANATIADDVTIGPYSCIGDNVVIDSGCVIGPHVVINGPTTIGKNNRFFQFSSIGEACQDKKYNGEPTTLSIGDNNVFREFCTVHRGTVQDIGTTTIGDDNLFMAYSHIAHDCVVGNNIIMANNATLAGHIKVADFVSLGGMVAIHQFCNIGAYSYIAGGSIVYKDVPPFIMASGYPAKATGLNNVGLSRHGFSKTTITLLKQAYKIIFVSSATVTDALNDLEQLIAQEQEVALFADFLKNTTRGIVR